MFDPAGLSFRRAEVSDRRARERLTRGGVQAGEVRIAGRGHARAEDLAAVRGGGADFPVRAASSYPRLLDGEDKRLDRLAPCRPKPSARGLSTGRWR